MAVCVMKPSDVYTRRPEIPEGWVYDGFRIAKKGEYYLFEGEEVELLQAYSKHVLPQIIVKKVEPPAETSRRRTVLVSVRDIYGEPFPSIPEGWVWVDFRLPQDGESYLPPDNNNRREIFYKSSVYKVWGPRIILERASSKAPMDWWE